MEFNVDGREKVPVRSPSLFVKIEVEFGEGVGKPLAPVDAKEVMLAETVGPVRDALPPVNSGTDEFTERVGMNIVPVPTPDEELTTIMGMLTTAVPDVGMGTVTFKGLEGSAVEFEETGGMLRVAVGTFTPVPPDEVEFADTPTLV